MYYIKNETTNKIIYFNSNKALVEEAKQGLVDYSEATIYETSKEIVVFSGSFYFEDDPELANQQKEKRRQEILDELDKLDLKSIRAIRANDQEYLVKYEAQAEELRKQLKELSGE